MINYQLRGRREEKTVYLRFRTTNIDLTVSTGRKSKSTSTYWKGGQPTEKDATSKNLKYWLQDLSKHLSKELEPISDKTTLNGIWFKNQISKFKLERIDKKIEEANSQFDKSTLKTEKESLHKELGIKVEEAKPTELIYWIDDLLENADVRENSKGSDGISNDRKRQYRNLKSLVEAYQIKIRKILHVQDIDVKTAKGFKSYLLKENYNSQTVQKKISDLKTVCRYAQSDVELSSTFHEISIGKAKTYEEDMDVIYLDFDEIGKIQSLDLKNERLMNARKWLIALCFTGQRGIDLVGGKKDGKTHKCQLVNENFKYIDGTLTLSIHQSKGNKTVLIPVLPPVADLYKNGLPRPISLQRLRDYFKELGKEAGIDTPTMGKKQETTTKGKRGVKKERPKYEYMSTHIGRRSMCTNFYGEMPTPYLMKITGHEKESTLLKYINQSTDDHLEEALKAFAKLSARKEKKTKLQVLKTGTNE